MSLKKKPDSEKSKTHNPYENTSIYKKNEKTGEWEVKNPSGSIAYNYLYRGDYEEEIIPDESVLDEEDKNR
ncbi:MAG: hypothetical protein MUP98_19250 [Candidatus Aminicenantes bacterium]|nr:hypothetical protein [Candidatus Aminicenantes bacterium]